MMNQQSVGNQISLLRNAKGITQSELGERLGVTFQAVSKWERGETLPDVSLLSALADVLETTVDHILLRNEQASLFKGIMKVQNIIDGILCLKRMGELLGKNNLLYRYAVAGINSGMNTDLEPAFTDEFIFEAFVAEAIIQNLKAGFYVDITDIKRNFKHEHFRNLICEYAQKHNIV